MSKNRKRDRRRAERRREVPWKLGGAVLAIAAGVLLGGCSPTENPAADSSPRTTPRQEGPTIEFVQGYARGYKEAKQSRKPLLIFFTAPQSVFCQQMVEDSFRDSRVVDLSQSFTCVQVDASEEPAVCREFQVEGYPTVQFLSARGVPLERIEGKCEASQLIPHMQAAIETIASREPIYSQPTLY